MIDGKRCAKCSCGNPGFDVLRFITRNIFKSGVLFFRVQKLPVGVECTLYLLQAVLRDQEFQENPEGCVLSENDLVCMYSTAIIRYFTKINFSKNYNY